MEFNRRTEGNEGENIEQKEVQKRNDQQLEKNLADFKKDLQPEKSGESKEVNKEEAQKESKVDNSENNSVNKETKDDNKKDFDSKIESMKDDLKPEPKQKEVQDISSLENTENFKPNALKHIFEGDVKQDREGNLYAGGYHYEGVESAKGKVKEETVTSPDKNGTYEAEVSVGGVDKQSNDGKSSFFSKEMSPQEVVDAINQAYDSREAVPGRRNAYHGKTDSGMKIEMYLDKKDNDKIISACPKYEENNNKKER